MSGGGLDHKEVIEQVTQRKNIKAGDVELVIRNLDEKKREEIKGSTKESFEKAIAGIRQNPDRNKENALILQTYAVLFLDVKSKDIGGIDGIFGPKTLAILRKCQANNIGSLGKPQGVDASTWDEILARKAREASTPSTQTEQNQDGTEDEGAVITSDKGVEKDSPLKRAPDSRGLIDYPDAKIWVTNSKEGNSEYVIQFGKSNLSGGTYNNCIFRGSAELKHWKMPEASPEKGSHYTDDAGNRVYITTDGRSYNPELHNIVTKNGKLRQFIPKEGVLQYPNGKQKKLG